MKLNHHLHLAYSTNIHRGENWDETFAGLEQYTLKVRDQVCPTEPYAIGLRLGDLASRELSEPATLSRFQKWLEQHNCYVFTVNGFPYGRFHGGRVKEQVYVPDWTTCERLEYTKRLFDLLAQLVPPGVEGSVSTSPCSFKEFIQSHGQVKAMRDNLWRCIDHIAALSESTGKPLHLGLEPEPLCFLETSQETVDFFDQMRADRPQDSSINRFLGMNYDTCHLAVEFEEPAEALARLAAHEVKISKLHFSSALKVQANSEVRQALTSFVDDVYLHQVVSRGPDSSLTRYRDLDEALARTKASEDEWRIHFHIPLPSPPTGLFGNTADHILGVMDHLKQNPTLCSHLEIETYTWEVMPAEFKNRSVVDQLVAEYRWCLAQLAKRGLATGN
ncbi:MAG: metabolite traffic protein EboE [Verrucomicrobia bacterium]|nr:metabolite traffic protein EboE [Verrucomicrobiota bacterium]